MQQQKESTAIQLLGDLDPQVKNPGSKSVR